MSDPATAPGGAPHDAAALPIEDYALIGDCRTAALVGLNGSIDWLCWPHFDSDACLASLLGSPENGRWRISPADGGARARRRYQGDTLVLETTFASDGGEAAVVDFMPVGDEEHVLVRRVVGRQGRVRFDFTLGLRFEYGAVSPWITDHGDRVEIVAGQNRVALRCDHPVAFHVADGVISAGFEVAEGEAVTFQLRWGRSHLAAPEPIDADEALRDTCAFWCDWAARCTYSGRFRDAVVRSLLTLKALSFTPTGAFVAAPTTSLPEQLGGPRNWDYRYCWLRDATLSLIAMMAGGYTEEAQAWVAWLVRAVAGEPSALQIMYGLGGERRLLEWEVPNLAGYQGAAPVRVGNAASGQLQLDTFGEVMSAMSLAREHGLTLQGTAWALQCGLLEHLEQVWEQPDDGIWEVRGGRRHFTHSKIMAWRAFDRAIHDAETYGLDAPLDRWRGVRERIHAEVCERGFDKARNTFTQSYGDPAMDASLLLIARAGFLPADDPRVVGTVKAVEEELLEEGFVLRYRTTKGVDGLPGREGAFLPCSYWLAGAYHQMGRMEEACALFDRLAAVGNDVGLQAEEYDAQARRMVGNFPQAYSHLSLVACALLLDMAPEEARTMTTAKLVATTGQATPDPAREPNAAEPAHAV